MAWWLVLLLVDDVRGCGRGCGEWPRVWPKCRLVCWRGQPEDGVGGGRVSAAMGRSSERCRGQDVAFGRLPVLGPPWSTKAVGNAVVTRGVGIGAVPARIAAGAAHLELAAAIASGSESWSSGLSITTTLFVENHGVCRGWAGCNARGMRRSKAAPVCEHCQYLPILAKFFGADGSELPRALLLMRRGISDDGRLRLAGDIWRSQLEISTMWPMLRVPLK